MTPQDIRTTRLQLGLSRAQLAQYLDIPLRTIEEWERRGRRNGPPVYLARALRDLERELSESR